MRATRARARSAALLARMESERPAHASIEVVFRWLARDKEIAGGVLGGGLAYRFFFWVLAITVLAAGGLGFAVPSGVDVDSAAGDVGATDAMAAIVATAAEQSGTHRWWLLMVGAWLTLWFSWGLLRALRLVHVAAWRIRPTPVRKPVRALGAVLAAPIVLLAMSSAAGWVRANAGGAWEVVAILLLAAGFGALWLWISMRLPGPDAAWTAFLPGAVVVAIGLEALHVFTVYFLEAKLANASELYGILGLVTTALFYLFLVGRSVVWAAELNAVVWEASASGAIRASKSAP
jgi:hypothetical protein